MASILRTTTTTQFLAIFTPTGVSGGGVTAVAGGTTVRENGVESTQSDRIYHIKDASVATSTTTSYDCAGSLLQPDGTAFLPARLDRVVLYNKGTVPLYVGPHGTAGVGALVFTKANGDLVVCNPGDTVILKGGVNGAVVTATTADILAVENPSASVVGSYDLTITGRST